MNIQLICLGSLKEDYLKQAQENLVAAITRKNGIGRCQVIELREEPLKDNAALALVEGALALEAIRISQRIPAQARIICLDIGGKPASEEFFSTLRKNMENSGQEDVVLIIGGSNGIDQSIKGKAHHRISFSHLTYPHQLFRIALLEALARYL